MAVQHAEYVNYCHQCGRAVSSARDRRCDGCGWLRCGCGACGCSYDGQLRLSALAMVPPGWSRLLAQPLAAPPTPVRLPRLVPVVTALALAAIVGALVLDGYLAVPELNLSGLPEVHVSWPWTAADSAAPTDAPAAGWGRGAAGASGSSARR
jgi:hypothetical protein